MKNRQFFYTVFFAIISLLLISCSFAKADDPNYEWTLTFEDNFDTFDTTKWITLFDYGTRTIWSNNELQWYHDKNVKVENGILKLVAKKEAIYGKDVESEKQFEYTSGMICSALGFAQAYGKWEIRARFPFAKGFWPAFWMMAKDRPGLPEIDVFEYYGMEKNKIMSAHHWGISYPNYTNIYAGKTEPFYYVGTKETEGNFADVWMVWTFECFPNKMVWKLNDKVVFEATKGIPTAPLYMIANVAILNRVENNFVVDDSNLPFIMEIDYIRAYKMVPKED